MPRPICVPCRREMFIVENGYAVHLLQAGDHPYQIWNGDLWECRACGAQVVNGFGQAPVAEHFEKAAFARELPYVKLEVPS